MWSILKYLTVASVGAMLLGSVHADTWRPDEFLTLDLSHALLSPRPLGPPAEFEAVPVEARAEPVKPAPPRPEPDRADSARADNAGMHAARTAPKVKTARVQVKPQPARQRIVRARRSPLDAQAADTRIQVWPCRSGALCNWKR